MGSGLNNLTPKRVLPKSSSGGRGGLGRRGCNLTLNSVVLKSTSGGRGGAGVNPGADFATNSHFGYIARN